MATTLPKIGQDFRIEGESDIFTTTKSSINRDPTQGRARGVTAAQLSAIPTISANQADELFRGIVQRRERNTPFVNSFRDIRLQQSELDSFLQGEQVGTPDLIRRDLGFTENPSGTTEAQGAPVQLVDTATRRSRQPNVAQSQVFQPSGTLRSGSRGEDVRQLQAFLNTQGFANLEEDGIFGGRTAAAVKIFQQKAGLANDSIVGPNTLAAIQAKQGHLGKASAPGSADQINTGAGEVNIPPNNNTDPHTSNASASNTAERTRIAEEQKLLDDEEKRRVEAIEKQQKDASAFQGVIGNLLGNGKESKTEELESEFNVDKKEFLAERLAKQDEITALETQQQSLIDSRDNLIQQQYGRLASTGIINNQINEIQRNYQPELNRMSRDINMKTAQYNSFVGNFNETQKFIQEAVSNHLADRADRIELAKFTYEQNTDLMNSLDSVYRDTFLEQIRISEREYDRDYKEKLEIASLMVDPDFAGAGITMDDSFQAAIEKASGVTSTGGGGKEEKPLSNSVRENLEEEFDVQIPPFSTQTEAEAIINAQEEIEPQDSSILRKNIRKKYTRIQRRTIARKTSEDSSMTGITKVLDELETAIAEFAENGATDEEIYAKFDEFI